MKIGSPFCVLYIANLSLFDKLQPIIAQFASWQKKADNNHIKS